VDHNENAEYESKARLVEIIDHHVNNLNRTDIETEINPRVGSCCSLIARRYLAYCEAHQLPVNEQIVLLLYGPIVLGNKQTHLDRFLQLIKLIVPAF
jgi:inorganic pyrophosphatase/exopolyphosphatase